MQVLGTCVAPVHPHLTIQVSMVLHSDLLKLLAGRCPFLFFSRKAVSSDLPSRGRKSGSLKEMNCNEDKRKSMGDFLDYFLKNFKTRSTTSLKVD